MIIKEIVDVSWYLACGFFFAFIISGIFRSKKNKNQEGRPYAIVQYIIGFVVGIFFVYIIKLIFRLEISDILVLLKLSEKENRIILIYYIILFIIGLILHNQNFVGSLILILTIVPIQILNFIYSRVSLSNLFSYFGYIMVLTIVGSIGLILIAYAYIKMNNTRTKQGVIINKSRSLVISVGIILMVCGFFSAFNLFMSAVPHDNSIIQSIIYSSLTILIIVGIKKKYKTFNTEMCLNPTTFTDKQCISYLDTKCKITPDDEICKKYYEYKNKNV